MLLSVWCFLKVKYIILGIFKLIILIFLSCFWNVFFLLFFVYIKVIVMFILKCFLLEFKVVLFVLNLNFIFCIFVDKIFFNEIIFLIGLLFFIFINDFSSLLDIIFCNWLYCFLFNSWEIIYRVCLVFWRNFFLLNFVFIMFFSKNSFKLFVI